MTRMHSSRMCTTCLLTASFSIWMLGRGGGGCLPLSGRSVSASDPGGSVSSRGVSAPLWTDIPLGRHTLLGRHLPGQTSPSPAQCMLGYTPNQRSLGAQCMLGYTPPPRGQTYIYKNITFANFAGSNYLPSSFSQRNR